MDDRKPDSFFELANAYCSLHIHVLFFSYFIFIFFCLIEIPSTEHYLRIIRSESIWSDGWAKAERALMPIDSRLEQYIAHCYWNWKSNRTKWLATDYTGLRQ